MIQDIAPHHFDNAYHSYVPREEDFAIYCQPHQVLLKRQEDRIIFPAFRDLKKRNDDILENATYLFQIDEFRFFLVKHVNLEPLSGFQMENTEIFRLAEPQYLAFAGITAYQLYLWYESRKFCGCCGSPLRHDEKERMMYCDHCHAMEFPKISPAVIIGLTHKNRLLLSKYAGRTYKKYALLAGYTEIGETVEETVSREVMEEVGLPVKNIRYYKSQPWPFSSTVLMGFFCDLDGDDETVTLDANELALAQWFERDEIPVTPSRDSLTNEMIMAFKNGLV